MRIKPEFKPDSSRKQSKENDSASCSGCFWMFIVTVGGYFVLLAINRVLSGQGNRFDHIICYGAIIGFVILVIMAIIQEHQNKIMFYEAQQKWKHECKSVEVAIVNRNYYPSGTWEDEYGIPHSSHSRYQLDLESTVEQRLIYPNLKSIRVDVYESTFTKVKDRNAVRVYYQPESPMIFLLEEEFG